METKLSHAAIASTLAALVTVGCDAPASDGAAAAPAAGSINKVFDGAGKVAPVAPATIDPAKARRIEKPPTVGTPTEVDIDPKQLGALSGEASCSVSCGGVEKTATQKLGTPTEVDIDPKQLGALSGEASCSVGTCGGSDTKTPAPSVTPIAAPTAAPSAVPPVPTTPVK